MCGIAGIISNSPITQTMPLNLMTERLIHRGPDRYGVWLSVDHKVMLAHRRLSIIDLSERANQPMSYRNHEYIIVFNGELYNFLELKQELAQLGCCFNSDSDTEVLLAAYVEWGESCLTKLNGMFAFAIYDQVQRKMFFARDRAGEKPLYYSHQNNMLYFASELKALLAVPGFERRLNYDALNFYLTYGFVPSPLSAINGVEKLSAAHAMVFDVDTGALRKWRYWDTPSYEFTENRSPQDLADELQQLLKDAVKKQMIADVPLGILLSGGCDSSLVVATAADVSGKPVNTYTVSFQGHESLDESAYAKIVADYFGTNHTQINAEDISVDVLADVINHFDEPFADHASIPTYMVCKSVKKNAKVALTGDGCDELFGGYPHYNFLLKLQKFKKLAPEMIRKYIAKSAGLTPVGIPYRNHVIGLDDGYPRSVALTNVYFDEYSRKHLLKPDAVKTFKIGMPEDTKANLCSSCESPLMGAMKADFVMTLGDGYLVKTDRSSMKSSVELRSPFLDYRIIEFAYRSVPDDLKVKNKSLKILPKLLGKKILPKELELERKQGFTMPISNFFKNQWGEFLSSIIREASNSIFNRDYVTQLLNSDNLFRSNSNRLYCLMVFEMWRRAYKVSL